VRYSHLTPDVRRATVRLLDVVRGDVGETEAVETKSPGLSGA